MLGASGWGLGFWTLPKVCRSLRRSVPDASPGLGSSDRVQGFRVLGFGAPVG